MFANMKIGVRLAIGFAAVLSLLVFIAVLGFLRISALNSQVEQVTADLFPKTVMANDVIDAVNVIARRLRNAYIFKDGEAQKEIEQIAEQRKIISDRLDKLEKTVVSEAGKAALKKINEARAHYVVDQDRYLETLKAGKRDEAAAILAVDLRKSQAEYMGAVNTMVDLQTELVTKAGKDAEAMADTAERLLIGAALVAALVLSLIHI